VSQWVGASVPRKEDRRLLLGRGRFVADLSRPGLLHAAFVRSPHAHARVGGIDAAAAATQPGVAAVFTAASLGHPYLLAVLERDEFIPTRMPVLAGQAARFVGEPVALVVADDPYRAEDSAELVEVNWDPRSAVMSVEAARAAAAPTLHEEADGNCLVDLLMFDDDRLPGIFADAAQGSARIRGDAEAAIPIAELARMIHFQAHRLAEDLRYGLEARASYDPPGTFSNACHVAMVTIDPGTCAVRLHRYLVVEDCGVVINPMVVDGQVRGGVTQGAAAALLERVCFDPEGQPASATLMDYLAPTAAEMCPVDIVHLQTPSRFSETRAKGVGEGGTIGAPAAVVGAINDALSDTDVRFDHIPVLPQDLSAALTKAGAAR
jgi:CO/xanthine dehydrogenase Mo-binding subunit